MCVCVLLFLSFSLQKKVMASKALLSFFLIFSSCVHQGFSDGLNQLLGGLGNFGAIKEAQCMQKLLPCKPYLKSPTNIPSACCAPLNQMVTNDTECLCSFFNNQELIASMKISKDDMLKLSNACGLAVDVSKCNTGASPPPTTGVNINPADYISASTSSTTTSSTKMITPYGIIHFGVPGFVALLTALVFSAN